MMKIGCHVLYVGDKVFKMHLIEVDDTGCCVRHYPFFHEHPSVYWSPGVCILLPEELIPEDGMSIKDVMSLSYKSNTHLFLWKADNVAIDTPYDTPVPRWVKWR